MQICAVDTSVSALLKPLIDALSEKHTVHNACTDTGLFEELEKQGLVMKNVPIDRKIRPISNIKSLMRLYKLIRKEQYDVVHVHTPIASILGRLAAKFAGVKRIIYTAHGFYFHEDMPKYKYYFYYYLEKVFAKFCTDWLFLQSEEDYQLCVRKRFKEKDRLLHISNGVDVKRKFNPAQIRAYKYRESLGIKKEDIVFCFIGRLIKEKGIFELMNAFYRLREHSDLSVKLLVIGDLLVSERDKESYKSLKKSLSDPAVIHLGYRTDVPELLSICDVFVLPSYREGLPRSIIEAMAMSKPVIATNIRGCREEVMDGVSGHLVSSKNSIELYEKMYSLAKDRDKRLSYGKQAREIAVKKFDEDQVINKQLMIFGLIEKEVNEDAKKSI